MKKPKKYVSPFDLYSMEELIERANKSLEEYKKNPMSDEEAEQYAIEDDAEGGYFEDD